MGRKLTSKPVPGDWNGTLNAIAKLDRELNTSASPAFAGVTLTGLTANALMYADSSGVLTSLAAATNGQLIIGSTGAAPSVAALTGTANQIIISNGAGSVTLSTPQNIHTGASPTFANLSLGTGELTAGSINRASGTLTLEIGGTAEISITSSTVTLGGNLIIPNAGYIGSVSDTDAIQIEADGDIVMSQDLAVTGSITAANYTAANLLTACATNAGELDFTDTGKKLDVEDDAVVSQDYSSDASPTFAGLTLSGLTDNAFIYPSSGVFTSLAVASHGQLIVGSTGATPVLATLTGIANQVTVTNAAGSITLSTPQDIHTGASPTFAGLTLTNCAVLGSDSAVFQPNSDATTFFQVLDADGGTSVFNVDTTNERVGIGTDSPVELLDIAGMVVTNKGTQNVLVGEGVANGDVAENNIFIGYHAGYNNDDSTPIAEATGTRNVYIGDKAGAGETGGSDNAGAENVAIGSLALRMNTTGYENTAIGDDALQFNTTGHGNVALGNDALQGTGATAITGSFNTGLGTDTLYILTSGGYNTAVGYQALYSTTTQSYQTAVGFEAGAGNTQDALTSFGYRAGKDATGTNQAAIGYQAGLENTGINQTALGYNAGYQNTGNNQNAFGYYAGRENTGNHQLCLGYYAGYQNTANSQAAVGFQAGYQNSGVSQAAFGYAAGKGNSGASQVAFGYQAGLNNTGISQSCFGVNAGNNNIGAGQTCIGTAAGRENTGANQICFGARAGYYNTKGDQTAVGNSAGEYNDGYRNTALGSEAFNTFTLDVGSAVDIDSVDHTTERVTIDAGHGFGANGSYWNLVITTTDTLPTGLSAGPHIWKVISATVLECKTDSFTDAGVGTHTLTPQVVYVNSTAIGYNAEPDASNQVMLGDANVTEVFSSGVGNFGGAKLGDGGTTNYTQFSATGAQTMAGTARVWKCVDLTPATISHPLAASPDTVYYPANLFAFDAYDDTAEEQIFFVWHVPNDYHAGTASVRGHFGGMVSNEAGLKYIAMGFQWFHVAAGDEFTFAVVDGGGAVNITIENGEGNYIWHESQTGVVDTTGIAAGDLILFRFFRDVDDVYTAVSDHDDDYIGDVLIGAYHLEYLKDKLGEAAT